MMKKLITISLMTLTMLTSIKAQNRVKAAVIGVSAENVNISPTTAESLLRIELMKMENYNVYDREDLIELGEINEIDFEGCLGKKCLHNAGTLAEVDKVFSGSIQNLGKKIVVTVKILDIKTGEYDKVAVQEFINMQSELQTMVHMTLYTALGMENNKETEETLVFFNEPPKVPTVQVRNSGPRMGIAYVGGELGSVLAAPEEEGGYDAFQVMSQFGYQFEKVYLSAGNFMALAEGLVMLTGLEQGIINPSITLLNGFRSAKSGWEVAFGPSVRLKKEARGYYEEGTWHLENEWQETTLDESAGGVSFLVRTENPNKIQTRMDKRGDVKLSATWVWAIGKTFHSGYLNIPVNAYFSHGKDGWFTGLSVGFNISNKKQ